MKTRIRAYSKEYDDWFLFWLFVDNMPKDEGTIYGYDDTELKVGSIPVPNDKGD